MYESKLVLKKSQPTNSELSRYSKITAKIFISIHTYAHTYTHIYVYVIPNSLMQGQITKPIIF